MQLAQTIWHLTIIVSLTSVCMLVMWQLIGHPLFLVLRDELADIRAGRSKTSPVNNMPHTNAETLKPVPSMSHTDTEAL